ncbi:hypothetical protein [Sulfurospirillum sp. 1612]|uniref:hypothetical protein n=1 Tax=Sulfurospirillum sp. 1612 TaxID=3094835 RepID=UPI002F921419
MEKDSIVNYTKMLKVKNFKKGMAFLDYYSDIQHDCVYGQQKYNSQRYYASNWGVSTATSNTWIKEFDKFLNSIYNS